MDAGRPANRTEAASYWHPCSQLRFGSSPPAACVVFYAVLTLLSVLTVCGNLLVIVSILYFKQLLTPTNTLVLSLAVADLLVGVLVIPLSMVFSLSWCLQRPGLFCQLRSSLDVSLSTCSIMNLCCISLDRYYAVCRPLTYKSRIGRNAVLGMIAASWGVSSLFGVSVIIPGLNEEECEDECFLNGVMTNTVGPILCFYLPVVVMLCIYLKVFLVARRQARSICGRGNRAGSVSKMESKATRTLATVLGAFLLCWTPFFLCITVLPFSREPVPLPVIETLNWLTLANSMLNPFIYAFCYSSFRSAFTIIVSGKILQGNFTNAHLQ